MSHRFFALFLMTALLFCAAPAVAQFAPVQGKVVDDNGTPIADGTVEMVSADTGRKLTAKTDKGGNYRLVAVSPGVYHVTLKRGGQVLWQKDYRVSLQVAENILNFDLQKERAAQAAKGPAAQPQLTEEQKKELEAITKENMKIKGLNAMLQEAAAALQANNHDQAIQILSQATQMDPTRDLLFFRLGDAQLAKCTEVAKTDRPGAAVICTEAAGNYQKAIDLAKQTTATQAAASAAAAAAPAAAAPAAGAAKGAAPAAAAAPPAAPAPRKATPALGAYYNNLGQALARTDKTDDAIKAYEAAALAEPANAGQYYYNMGAVLTNKGRVDDAIAAFDKAVAADPDKADAFYWKGVNLLGKATMKDGKMTAPEGTAEALNKYLELQPEGPFAQASKDLLASFGAEIETSFKKREAKKKK